MITFNELESAEEEAVVACLNILPCHSLERRENHENSIRVADSPSDITTGCPRKQIYALLLQQLTRWLKELTL